MHRSPFKVIAYTLVTCIVRTPAGPTTREHVQYRGRFTAANIIERELRRFLWARGTPLVSIEGIEFVFENEEGVTMPQRGA